VKGVVLERQVILIENDSIKWVKADDPGAAPKEAKTIDLSDYTVLPGAD
jgi:imidazolonepropionase-like amidohydrolase